MKKIISTGIMILSLFSSSLTDASIEKPTFKVNRLTTDIYSVRMMKSLIHGKHYLESSELSELCLTANIFHESGGESRKTKELAGLVTIHRVKHKNYPKTYCRVVETFGGLWIKQGRSFNSLTDKKGWESSNRVARDLLSGKIRDFIPGALYLNHKSQGKRFRTKVKPIIVGNLIGY